MKWLPEQDGRMKGKWRPSSGTSSPYVGRYLFCRRAGPLALVLISPHNRLLPLVSIGSLVLLALLGAVGARAGGAGIIKPTLRVTFWGALAMGVTAGIGALFGKAV